MGSPEDHFDKLISVMARLRDPENGCPWDLEQSFETIAPHTIEEAYEVLDAIERNDMDALREELGDLLFQPVYHAQMAAEAGYFDIYDVIQGVTEKMINRHPHVFGDKKAEHAGDVNKIWEQRKKAEKETKQTGALGSVAKALPALLRAQKLIKRAAHSGFEWPGPEAALNKLEEELEEMQTAIKSGTPADQAEELGDVLFALVGLAQKLGIEAETALRRSNKKFEFRFRMIEENLKLKNKDINNTSTDEMLELWEEQKSKSQHA